MRADLRFLCVFWLQCLVCESFIEKVCDWAELRSEGQKKRVRSVCLWVLMMCVCWVEVIGCLSTHSSCGGRSYESNRHPRAEGAEQRAVPYNWRAWLTLICTFYEVPFVPHPSLRPPFPSIRSSFLRFSHTFLSFWLAGAVKYVCRGGSLGNCLKITGWRVANVPWRSDSCAKDSVIKNKLKSQIHMWGRQMVTAV